MILRKILATLVSLVIVALACQATPEESTESAEMPTKYPGISYYVAQADTGDPDAGDSMEFDFMGDATTEMPAAEEPAEFEVLDSSPMGDEASSNEPIPDLPDLDLEMPVDNDVTLELPGEEVREALMTKEAETISVDFPDEEIRTIIRNVADLYDLNVVIPDTLVGSTSIKLRNVTWRQVFEVILEPIAFTYIEDRNIIKIKSNEELLQEPVDTRVFVINFATAGELQASITPLVDSAAGGRIQVDTRSNGLVITERPSRMNRIQEIIERLDRPTAQVMIESKFIEVTDRDSQNLGVNWASLNSYSLTAGPWSRAYSRDIQGQATNSTLDDNLDTNTADTNFLSTIPVPGVPTNTTTINNILNNTGTVQRTLDLINSASQGRVDSAVFNADAFNVVLSALKSLSDVKLVSNPTVVTVNNTEAKINIGEEFPIPDYTYNDERGTFEVSGFTYKAIGIILKVTPQVNSAGFINLNIAPEISSRAGTVNFGGAAGAEIPIVATRKTESTVTIKDGFTLAIGGLVETTEESSTSKVPFLGSIPAIGKLFSSKTKSLSRRNLIIFITAKTLNPDGSTYEDIFSPKFLHEMGVTPRDAPGYELPPEEQRMYKEIQSTRDTLKEEERDARLRRQLDVLHRIQGGELKKRQIPQEDKKVLEW